MVVFKHSNLASAAEIKQRLNVMAALDIIMTEKAEEWLRVYFWLNDGDVSIAKVDNGGGDSLYAIFSPQGTVLKGFDHESSLSPYARDDDSICAGIYDELPPALQPLLERAEVEGHDVTFCLWQEKGQKIWYKGDVDSKEDDGTLFLLDFLHKTALEWTEWAMGYYEVDELPAKAVEQIYKGKAITEDMIQSLNPGRNSAEVLQELEEIGYGRV